MMPARLTRALFAMTALLAASSCGGAGITSPRSAACPVDVSGPADLLSCFPGAFGIGRVTSNDHGFLVQVDATSGRADFGGLHVVEAGRQMVLYIDADGVIRWHGDVECSSYGCALALAPDGSAIVIGRQVTWFSSAGVATSFPGKIRAGVSDVAFANDGTAIAVSVERGASTDEAVRLWRLSRDGNVVRVGEQTLGEPRVDNPRGGVEVTVDGQGHAWLGARGASNVDIAVVDPRSVSFVPLEPAWRGFRKLSRGGVFVQAWHEPTCPEKAVPDRGIFAVLQGTTVVWSRCVARSGLWVVDADVASDGIAVVGGMGPGATLSGQSMDGANDTTTFVAQLAWDGTVRKKARVTNASLGHVQILADGRVLALGSFRDGAFVMRMR